VDTISEIHHKTQIRRVENIEVSHEKERPITTLNWMGKKVSGLDKNLFDVERQFIAVRDRLIEDILASDKDFVCPGCSRAFMDFEEDKRSYMNCPKCGYIIVFGTL
jgi:DNA-directed RNA polymerase subunit RPC12/RpoP